jgi:Flp pilus assembly protein TadG
MIVIKILRKQSKKKKRMGAMLVEFAIVSPILILFIFALIEFARMVMVQHALTNTAREGCRRASLATTLSKQDVDSFIRDKLRPTITDASNSNVVVVTVTPVDLSGVTSDTPVTVSVQANYSNVSWIPLNSIKFLNSTVVKGSSTMIRE